MKINKKQGGILGGTLAVLLSAAIALFSSGDPSITMENFKGELIETSTYEIVQDHEYLSTMTIELDDTILGGTAELVLFDEVVDEVQVKDMNIVTFKALPIIFNPVSNLQLRLKTDGEYLAVGEFTDIGGVNLIVKEAYIDEK